MFAGLFEEETGQTDVKMELGNSVSFKSPPPPRNHTQLCGLSNLGATCYLNSLLQTLHYTPEFREALFSLGEDELGVYSSEKGADNSTVRLIPVQLQKLFAKLLLLNQQSTEVSSLTNSFGWNNNEELQQHDVQELNRILFAAIESSLLGTRGQHMIGQLYHGTSVQQILCCRCSGVSERVEEFQDIQVPLSGRSGLEQALKETYIDTEILQGPDQYWCEGCQQLVDAVRSCRLKKLPHVLTFGLLRFLYNFQKGERYKDTSKFKFPLELDMAPFCDSVLQPEEAHYELFSVVIHRGSTHSGHYTALIRDIDDLGVWQEELDQVPTPPPSSPTSGQMDVIDCETPSELIQMVIQQLGGSASVTKLCKALQENTGVSWNTRFKKQFGSIQKFLRDCPSLFSVDDTNQVTLKEVAAPSSSAPPSNSDMQENGTTITAKDELMMDVSMTLEDAEMTELDSAVDNSGNVLPPREEALNRSKEVFSSSPASKRTKRAQPLPPSGYRWFQFNDAQVSPSTTKAIEKMYQGKQSAYMLFYRRRSLKRPTQAKGNPSYGVPEQLLREVATLNNVLDEERAQYSVVTNTLKLNVHFSWQYQLVDGTLQRIAEGLPLVVRIDRRKPFSDLKSVISETVFEVSGRLGAAFVVNIAKHLSGGIHLYDAISGDEQATLSTLGLSDETHLFVWNGMDIGGNPVLTGKTHEPIVLHLNYSIDQDEKEMDICVPRSTTLGELRDKLAGLLDTSSQQVTISQVKMAGRQEQHSTVVVLTASKDKRTMDELGLCDGDRLAAEKEAKKGVRNLAHSVADKQNKLLSFIMEDRCSPLGSGLASYPVYPMETSKDEVLFSLKKQILAKLGVTSVAGGGRLRIDDDNNGLGPPLYEDQTLSDAGLVQGQRVIVEPGPAPQQSEVVLYFSTGKMSMTYERVFDNKTTVKECCLDMQQRMGLKDDNHWHLRKTNWCGEPAELLDEETATLAQEKLKSGDTLIVEEGRLPPKGFVRLSTYLYSPQSDIATNVKGEGVADMSITSASVELEALQDTSVLQGERDSQKAGGSVPLHLQPPEQYYPMVPGSLLEMDCVEISKDATVEDLKSMILTLPAMQGVNVLSPSFLRVQEIVDGRPGKILKVSSHTLRRSKLTSSAVCCVVLPYEEALPTSSIVFNVCIRNPVNRTYGPQMEVVYDTINGTEPHDLCGFVARLLELPLERVSMAKHKYETFEWIKIAGQSQDDGGRKRKVRAGTKVNIKNTPIFLRDGDTVGVKDLATELSDPDDFSTSNDDKGKAILTAIQEDKKKRRRNKAADIFCSSSSRRPELGIKIFVPDYSSLSHIRQS